MYYFNAESKLCKLFFYGGCRGNANKFETVEECKQTCNVDENAQNSLDSGAVCNQARKCGGSSSQAQSNWVFNPNSGNCEDGSGLVTSCQDNSGNSFEGRNLCQAYCVSKAVLASSRSLQTGESRVTLPARVDRRDEADPCLMDKLVGRCRAALRRFYFDKTSGTCKGFFYGGCGGNANNFASKVECEAKCQ